MVTPAESAPVVEVGALLVDTSIVVVVGGRVVVLESVDEEVESEPAGEHPPTAAANRAITATMRTGEVLTTPWFHAAAHRN
ncbi:hypothetical protein BH23ACT4_BH23ACT4_13650 [soil metagenome]